MGVPRLYPWIRKNFNYAIKNFLSGETNVSVDYVYIDGNSFLHKDVQEVFHYGKHKRMMNVNQHLSDSAKRKKAFQKFFEDIFYLTTEMVIPKKAIYIAIDGPAPLAKQNQQRERRFERGKERLEEETQTGKSEFDSSALSPGTLFMLELTKYMNYAIRKEMNNYGLWRDLEVYFSPPTVAGEGEHKAISFIRNLPENERVNSSHCLCGNDADLIMLTLAVHIPNMYLLREDDQNRNPGGYNYLDMGKIRKDLVKELPPHPKLQKNVVPNDEVLNNVTNDFIVSGFFVGNDFLPKIQMFHVGDLLEEGLGLMLSTCRQISKESKFLTENGKMDLDGFKLFVNKISEYEEIFLINQAKRPQKSRDGSPLNPKFENKTLSGSIDQILEPGDKEVTYKLDMEKYRKRYYIDKCEFPGNFEDEVFKKYLEKMCKDYLKSFVWVFKYYVDGLPSWRWAYEYHYAPLMFDFNNYLQNLSSDEFEELSKFNLQSPSLPFEQLLSILPPSSADLLPSPYRKLMTDPKSELVKLGYYPTKFKVDYEGKLEDFQGVPILPFVDYDVVHKNYEKVTKKYVKDPNKYVRNIPGKDSVFRYDKTYHAKFTSDMGNIDRLHVRKTFLEK